MNQYRGGGGGVRRLAARLNLISLARNCRSKLFRMRRLSHRSAAGFNLIILARNCHSTRTIEDYRELLITQG